MNSLNIAKKLKSHLLLVAALLLCVNATFAEEKQQKPTIPWNIEELFETPSYQMGDLNDGVVEILYSSIEYRGEKKEVFAYYCTPGLLNGNRSMDKDLPAVVCVHGGGGRAFEQWVRMWAERGYAAISMDLRGYGAGGAESGQALQNGFKEGADGQTPTFVSYDDHTEDWFYQAVGDVIAAHSLIRSFDEVDPKSSAIVGVSWGGIITSVVSGLDKRFAAAVPIYGCGYLYESGAMAPQIVNGGQVTQSRWRTMYDPSLYLGSARMPIMFVNGTNDHHFFTNQWQKSSDLASKRSRSMRLELAHGHNAAWGIEEVYEFVNSQLFNEYPQTPQFAKPKYSEDGTLACVIKNIPEGSRAYLIYTTHPTVAEEAQWVKCEVPIVGRMVTSPLLKNCRQSFFTLETPSGASYSSAITFTIPRR